MIQNNCIADVVGLIKIKDISSGEILCDTHNEIHFGNFSRATARAMYGDSGAFIKYMMLGSGGTTISGSGEIIYKQPQVSISYSENDGLYSQTYYKALTQNAAINGISVITSNYQHTELNITVTLDFNEPAAQEDNDGDVDSNNDYVFDEIALYTAGIGLPATDADAPVGGILLTHAIFNPIAKAKNRSIEIEYILRIQMIQP